MLCWPNLFALVGGFGPRECAGRAHRWDAARVTFDPGWDPIAHQDQVLGPLVRVIEEAASDAPWALIGATAIRLQGVEAHSPNLEFMTTEPVISALGEMLGIPSDWGQGRHLAANRLHFMRHDVPVFVFGDPVFHGPYESLSPRDIPSLWDARVRIEVNGIAVAGKLSEGDDVGVADGFRHRGFHADGKVFDTIALRGRHGGAFPSS